MPCLPCIYQSLFCLFFNPHRHPEQCDGTELTGASNEEHTVASNLSSVEQSSIDQEDGILTRQKTLLVGSSGVSARGAGNTVDAHKKENDLSVEQALGLSEVVLALGLFQFVSALRSVSVCLGSCSVSLGFGHWSFCNCISPWFV